MADRYELAKKFKIGNLVRVKDNISITTRRHGEDGQGKMNSMRGKTFKIVSVDSDRIHSKGFMWAPEDLINLSEDIEPLPLPKTNIMFDPKELF
jgi:hypothetical protein